MSLIKWNTTIHSGITLPKLGTIDGESHAALIEHKVFIAYPAQDFSIPYTIYDLETKSWAPYSTKSIPSTILLPNGMT